MRVAADAGRVSPPARYRLLALLALLIPGAAAAQLRVMSVNVRLPLASDGPNDWPNRRAVLADTVRRADPDVIGTQELFRRQDDDIVAALPRYRWFGRDRRGGHADEHMGVFYRADRLTLLGSGDFWLSDTPAVPGSISWGNLYPRMVTWGAFRTRGGRRFYMFDTHLPYRAGDEAAREKGAALILARVAAIAGGAPVVLTGDFNTVPGSETHRLLATRLRDAWQVAPAREGPAATFHGFTGRADRRIDWVFARGLRATRVRVLTGHDRGRYPSDHFPVVVDYR